MTSEAIDITNLHFAWKSDQPLLDIPSLKLPRGESAFLQGPSGCGKSTLLNLIGGLLLPQQGKIEVLGQDLSELSPSNRDAFRADHLGVVFQMFNLLPYMNVLDNVILPCRFSKLRMQKAKSRDGSAVSAAKRLLSDLELADKSILNRPVTELSIGQQQRVAVARALIGAPELLIADEPTSALDSDNRQRFIDLLLAECTAEQVSVLFVSHDASLQGHFSHALCLNQLNRACSEVDA